MLVGFGPAAVDRGLRVTAARVVPGEAKPLLFAVLAALALPDQAGTR
jgi:hypothetical protein